MLKLIRIQGDSMRPEYRCDDYVVIARPLWRRIRAGDDVVVRHPVLGTIFKRIESLAGDRLRLTGLDSRSTPSDEIGSVARTDVLGRVILHIRAR
ncbi:MAG: S24/S26 family peptidase [Gammaproteobacteria bacterium]|nr:S24/S26 family peptidase [Gammaproteobacteria bacterium]